MKSSASILLFSVLLLFVCGCHVSITRYGYELPEPLPNMPPCKGIAIKNKATFSTDEVISLGKIKASDTGFSMDCSEEEVLNIFRYDACALNAHLVNIIEETHPNWISTCYRATAELLKFKKSAEMANIKSDPQYSPNLVKQRSQVTIRKNAASIGIITGGLAGGIFGGLAGMSGGIAAGAASGERAVTPESAVSTAPTLTH
jgi:hypothetical protein